MDQDERFESLFRRYYGRVLHYLLRNYRLDRDDASDLAQDIFLRVFAVAEEYPRDQEWRFIETVTRNVVLNRLRDRHAKRRADVTRPISPTDRVTNAPDEPPPQEKAATARELANQLYEAINALPAGLRAALFLRLSEFTYVEIAQALSITLPAVKARLHEARRQLRALLPNDPLVFDEIASHEYEHVVPQFARQKLSGTASVSSGASLEEAAQELVEKVEALSAQQQHLSRQIDEYELMLSRYLGTIAGATSSHMKTGLS